jgi:hypothetical protein
MPASKMQMWPTKWRQMAKNGQKMAKTAKNG